MTATQTVAVPSAPGMKAREPSFTLDSDDDDGDTVEREISLDDDDDDDDGRWDAARDTFVKSSKLSLLCKHGG